MQPLNIERKFRPIAVKIALKLAINNQVKYSHVPAIYGPDNIDGVVSNNNERLHHILHYFYQEYYYRFRFT